MSKDTSKKEKKEQKNNFMKELKSELKKVTWPSKKELISNTVTVIVITLIVAAIVFVLDFAFEKLNTYGVEKLKSVVTTMDESTENEVVENTTENTVTGETVDTNTTVTENTTPEATTIEATPETQVTEPTTAE